MEEREVGHQAKMKHQVFKTHLVSVCVPQLHLNPYKHQLSAMYLILQGHQDIALPQSVEDCSVFLTLAIQPTANLNKYC